MCFVLLSPSPLDKTEHKCYYHLLPHYCWAGKSPFNKGRDRGILFPLITISGGVVMEQQPEKSHRGGQQGNKNALKHGYYSKVFTKEEKSDYYLAGNVEGIDEEIALLRHTLKSLAGQKDAQSIVLMNRTATSLNKLIRTRDKVQSSQFSSLQRAVAGVVEDFLIPMGVNIGHGFFKQLNVNNQSTNRGGNEANLP
jgi:hypothetical protein